MPFRLLEHTADMGLEAEAASKSELFAEAALALLNLLGGAPPARLLQRRVVQVTGSDDVELLVNWLNELLFQVETRAFFPGMVRIVTLAPGHLVAELQGEPLDLERHRFDRDAKAVTYHQLVLEQRADFWYARLYVDL